MSPRAEFDQSKISELLAIVARLRPEPDHAAKEDLIRRTQQAVIELEAAREDERSDPKRGDELELLNELAESAARLSQAWGAVSSHSRLRGIFDDHLSGLRLLGPPVNHHEDGSDADRHASKLAEMMARGERVARIEGVVGHDLWWLIGEMRALSSALANAGESRNAAEYRCAHRLAVAWADNVGGAPAISRNEPGTTPFQRFVSAAVLRPPIGSGVLRNVVEAIRLGRKRREKPT